MRVFITDRTQADVDRCKELAAIGWGNMTEAEKAEWYGTAMRGAYNFSDLNRVEAAVAELSEFLGMGLTTKVDWGKWDAPNETDMGRYASNLQKVNTQYGIGANIPSAMNSLTRDTANNIEKMLQSACEKMDNSDAWVKKAATVEYDWLYARDDASGGQTGSDTMWSAYGGMMQATSALVFDTRTGFRKLDRDVALDGAAGQYVISDDRCVARQITSAFATGNTKESVVDGRTMYEIKYSYKVVGYATRTRHAYCSVGSHSYGRVLVSKGELPSGSLIEGSLAAGYCYMLDENGDYYYYELC